MLSYYYIINSFVLQYTSVYSTITQNHTTKLNTAYGIYEEDFPYIIYIFGIYIIGCS